MPGITQTHKSILARQLILLVALFMMPIYSAGSASDFLRAIQQQAELRCLKNNLGCGEVGDIYYKTKTSRAAEFYAKACNPKDPRNGWWCYVLGEMHYEGKGLRKNSARANELFNVACMHYGSIQACNKIAYAYLTGIGGRKNVFMAAQLYEWSCGYNSGGSCNQLGYLYHRGIGVDKRPDKAKVLFEKACDAGSRSGCINYYGMVKNGRMKKRVF